MLSHYRALGKLRKEHSALTDGDFRFVEHGETSFVFERANAKERILVFANMGDAKTFAIPKGCTNALTGEKLAGTLMLERAEWAILLVK